MEDNKPTILIVDDQTDIVNTLSDFLSKKGYKVIGALGGKCALDILKEKRIDLIILDILMPDIKGSEVARAIKKVRPEAKIIIITAHPSEGEGLYREGLFEALFIKPFKLEELQQKAAEILNPEKMRDKETGIDKGTTPEVTFIKAKLFFIGASPEVYDFLGSEFKQLVYRGQDYELDAAFEEKEILKKLKLSVPDIIILDTSYLEGLDYNTQQRLRPLCNKAKEVMTCDLSSSVCEYNILGELIEHIKDLCLKDGLVEIRNS